MRQRTRTVIGVTIATIGVWLALTGGQAAGGDPPAEAEDGSHGGAVQTERE